MSTDDILPDFSRTAIYARYSDDIQNPSSIRDQIRLCTDRITAFGGTVSRHFADAASIGAFMIHRPELLEMIRHCKQGLVTTVCAESLDRISRSASDISRIYHILKYHDVAIWTVEDGPVGPVHIGFKGTMNEIFLDSLRSKTIRGKEGVAREGRHPAPLIYGYRNANTYIGKRLVRGLREIDPEEAKIVQWIFELRADGTKVRAIMRILNEEGIPAPRGGKWQDTTILGGGGRGLLRQSLYRGVMTYNKRETRRHPETGRLTHRPRPPSQWITSEDPTLRIIDEDLWNAVQEINRKTAIAPRRTGRTPAHLGGALPLTPVLRCASCGGRMRRFGSERWMCRNAHEIRTGTCNAPTFHMRNVEEQAANQLLAWVLKTRNWTRKREKAIRLMVEGIDALRAEINDKQERVQNLMHMLERGSGNITMTTRIAELEREIEELKGTIAAKPPSTTHISATEFGNALKTRIRKLHQDIHQSSGEPQRLAAVLLGQLMDRIVMSAGPRRGQAWLRIEPDLPTLLRWAAGQEPS